MREAVDSSSSRGDVDPAVLPERLRLFGISALAPVQVELIQALSGLLEVEIYLLTPCPDLWQRCGSRRASLGEDWLVPLPMVAGWLKRLVWRLFSGGWVLNFSSYWKAPVKRSWGSDAKGDLFAGSPADRRC